MLKKSHILLVCSLICSACAPLGSSGGSDLEQRVEQQDMQLRQMQPQQADAWNQIQAMRQEINQLKGQLDDLNNAGGARALADRVRQHDQALRQVDNNMALNLELGQPMASTPPAAPAVPPAPGQSAATPGIQLTGNAPDSSAYSAPQTGNYGLPPDTPAATAQSQAANQWVQVTGPSEETWGKADPRPEVKAPTKDISLALFDAGVNAYNARNYASAEKSFKDFLKNYPNHTQTAEAQFYLAECDFQRNQFPQAAVAYDAVITKYPKSSSAPGAYLKQAICFSKMNQKDAARLRMQEIIKKFPNSPEAARAKSFLKANK